MKTMKMLGIAFSLVTLVITPLFAAQGQITEVNPSGVHGKVVILQADEGDEVVKGDTVAFTNPTAFQKGGKPKVGDVVELAVVKTGKSVRSTVTSAPSTHTGSTGTTSSD